MSKNNSFLKVKNLKKHFPVTGGLLGGQVAAVHAVDGITFNLKRGERFGLVGESGCGKSTVAHLLIGLQEPTDGEIFYEGKSFTKSKGEEKRKLRQEIGMVFQDPYSSLNPRMSIKDIIKEPLDVQAVGKREEREAAVEDILDKVGLDPSYLTRYPYECSGGEKQRIAIARALITEPKFLIGDEPASALDVSIRAQILHLIEELADRLNLTCLFISHDLSVIEYISETIAVMYLGKFVEKAPVEKIYGNPLHPYTKALLSAVPVPGETSSERIILRGSVPTPINPPSGCNFHPRCFECDSKCDKTEPELVEVEKDHFVACHEV